MTAPPPDGTPLPRKPRTPFVGPLFRWELVRLARRGQDARARTVLAVALLLTLFVMTVIWFPDTGFRDLMTGGQQKLKIEETSRFANQFSLALLLAQMGVMVLIAPAYAAGGVAEEKERKTFPFLLATDLSNREIVLGKFLGRVVFLLGVMLAGLPILALTGLVGGIDPAVLAISYLLTGTTVLLVSAAGVASAVFAGTFRGAMFRAYGLTALYVLFGCGIYPLLSPFAVLVYANMGRGGSEKSYFVLLGLYVFGQLLLTAGAVAMAVLRVRGTRRKLPTPPPRRDEPAELEPEPAGEVEVLAVSADAPTGDVVRAKPLAVAARRKPRGDPARRRKAPPPVYHPDRPKVFADDPFYWKEKYTLGAKRTADEDAIQGIVPVAGAAVAVVLGVILAGSVLVAVVSSGGAEDNLARVLILSGTLALFFFLLTLGTAAVQTVLRERQRNTLESLLCVPADRGELLWPKWRVCFDRGWWWGGTGMAAVLFGLFVSRVSVAAIPGLVFLPALAAFTVSFGVWLSVRSRTTSKALVTLLAAVTPLVLVPYAVFLAFDRGDVAGPTAVTAAAAAGTAFGAWRFWKLACRAFDADGRE